MQKPELKQQKHKRILLMYDELGRHKINYKELIKFMSYVFSISEPYLMVIIKNYTLQDFECVKLEHTDLDNILVDSFVRKCYKQAQQSRKSNQLQLTI